MTLDDARIEDLRKHSKHYAWSAFLSVLRRTVPNTFRGAIFQTFAAVTPSVPVDLRTPHGNGRGWRVFWIGATAGWAFCLFGCMAFSAMSGALAGHDTAVVYFSRDYYDLLLYTVICPAYLGLSFWLISLFICRHSEICQIADEVRADNLPPTSLRLPVAFLLMFTVACLLTCGYISDILKISNVPDRYWFMATSSQSQHYLNLAGIYYVILNFALLLVVVCAVFCFFSMFTETIRLGTGIGKLEAASALPFDQVKSRLTAFTKAYVLGKALCGVLMLNVLLWHKSHLGNTSNVDISVVMGLIMGVGMVSFPRYYVELMWRQYEQQTGSEAPFRDIRDKRVSNLAWLFDFILISAFVSQAPHLFHEKHIRWFAESAQKVISNL